MKRYAIVLGVAVAAGLAKLAVIRLETGGTGWWEATGSVIDAVLTGVVLVAALEWVDRRRWQPANRAGLVSFARTVHLAASGWSAPEGLPPPDLRSGPLAMQLETESRNLREQATRLTEFASDIGNTDNETIQTVIMHAAAWAAAQYWDEGSRSRRLAALARLDDIALPRLLSRDRDPLVEGLFSQFNLQVTTALTCAHHADSVIRERLLLPNSLADTARNSPTVMAHVQANPHLAAIDPAMVFIHAIRHLFESSRDAGDKSPKLVGVTALTRCVNGLRNEIVRVADALDVLHELVSSPDLARRLDAAVEAMEKDVR